MAFTFPCFLVLCSVLLHFRFGLGRKLGVLSEDSVLDFIISLPLSNEHLLDQFLYDLYNPEATENVHPKYLSPDEFHLKFGPSGEQIEKVKCFCRSNNFRIHPSNHPNHHLIEVSSRVKEINSAFKIQIEKHQHDDKNYFYIIPDKNLTLPDEILTVLGLDNSTRPHHRNPKQKRQRNLYIEVGPPLQPMNIRKAYNLIGINLKGKGETIAVVEFDNFKDDDILYYVKNLSLADSVSNVKRVYAGVHPPHSPVIFGGQAEATLDIQLILTIAPEITILVYISQNTWKDDLLNYKKIADENLAKVISTSWGLDEEATPSSFIISSSKIFKQMAAQGQTVFCASGDYGAYDGNFNGNNMRLWVQYPASHPFVTGVGGTQLTFNQTTGAYISEMTWWDGFEGSGGGVSKLFAIPEYQKSVISYDSLGSKHKRNIPDVSLHANGYLTYVNGKWGISRGTSCSTPIWAAFVSLVNEKRNSMGKPRIGFINPILYSIANQDIYNRSFHDINDLSTNGHYPAVNGFDLATGLGSFNGNNLFYQLSGCFRNGTNTTTTSPTTSGNEFCRSNPKLKVANCRQRIKFCAQSGKPMKW